MLIGKEMMFINWSDTIMFQVFLSSFSMDMD